MRDGKAVPHPTKGNVNSPGRGALGRHQAARPLGAPPASTRPDGHAEPMTTDDTRPPAGMEYKGAASLLAPRPGVAAPATGTVAPEGIVELIAAVTGVKDDVR